MNYRKIAILGFRREGKNLLKFLFKSPIYKNAEIVICDRDTNIQIHTNNTNVKFQTGENYLKNLNQFDIIFRSPGVPYNLPEIQKAIKANVKFSSATQLFFDEIRKTTVKNALTIIGITGTKGKSTTSTLLYKILKACDKNTYLVGNIGKPVLDIISKMRINTEKNTDRRKLDIRENPRKSTFIVLELSSFQLQDLNQSPDIAIVLDIFPDHLDSHKNFNEYFNAKANIAKWQKKTDKIFYFAGDKYSQLIAKKSQGKKNPIDISFLNYQEFENKIKSTIKINGEHNFKNTIMVAKVALSLGCPKEKIIKTIKNFRGLEHRLEFVRTIRKITQKKIQNYAKKNQRQSASISFYNDSASTNPQTAAAAIRSFNEPKILIAGGKDKNLNYSSLAKALKNSNTKLVILFGENKNKIKKAIKNSGVPIKLKKNLETATKTAYQFAKKSLKLMVNNQWLMLNIIFSPASASFDMFKDYKDRGEKFKKFVKKLK
ncbi:MAG: UDP-N-acetylmuramoyl-L-alanine--D-glutamate ligase [Patescibacteria group bacterium]